MWEFHNAQHKKVITTLEEIISSCSVRLHLLLMNVPVVLQEGGEQQRVLSDWQQALTSYASQIPELSERNTQPSFSRKVFLFHVVLKLCYRSGYRCSKDALFAWVLWKWLVLLGGLTVMSLFVDTILTLLNFFPLIFNFIELQTQFGRDHLLCLNSHFAHYVLIYVVLSQIEHGKYRKWWFEHLTVIVESPASFFFFLRLRS